MLSHSVFPGNNSSQLQFIDDLIGLCKRHNISCGEPQDLVHLGADLLFNDDFRADLFPLCAAIGHMAEVELSPEQLLVLVARAFGGPGVSLRDGAADIPHAASSAFLNGYKAWLARASAAPDSDSSRSVDRSPIPVSPKPRPTLYYSAASLSGSDPPRPREEPPVSQPAIDEPSGRSLPPNTPIESLTLNELKMYLADIESRVSRIEPKLEQITPGAYFSPEYFERLEALDVQHRHETKPDIGVRPTEPAVAPEYIVPTRQHEPTPAPQFISPHVVEEFDPEVAYAPKIVPYHSAIASDLRSLTETLQSASNDAHLRRLRTLNIVLASLLGVACIGGAISAYHYLNPHPATFDDTISRFPRPLGQPSSEPSDDTPTTTDVQPPAVQSPASPIHTAVHASAAPARVYDTYSHHTSRKRMPASLALDVPFNPHVTVLTEPDLPPSATQSPQLPAPSPAATPASVPTPAPTSTRPLVASAASPAPRPVDTPALPVTTQPTRQTNPTVAVSSGTIMNYAVSAPRPIYLGARHLGQDNTVSLETTISRDGRVVAVRALDGAPDVRAAAIEAVQGWRFKPFLLEGTPVAVLTTFKFVFPDH